MYWSMLSLLPRIDILKLVQAGITKFNIPGHRITPPLLFRRLNSSQLYNITCAFLSKVCDDLISILGQKK